MPNRGYFPPRLSPLSISPAAFGPYLDTYDYMIGYDQLRNATSLELQSFVAPLILPDGVTVTKMTLYGNREDALAEMSISLYRFTEGVAAGQMAVVIADWTSGYSSGYTETIANPTIDNANYGYGFNLQLDPNDDVTEVNFRRVKIEFAG
ncbi:hypothetical protein ES702_06359 [subsurface metagenome]